MHPAASHHHGKRSIDDSLIHHAVRFEPGAAVREAEPVTDAATEQQKPVRAVDVPDNGDAVSSDDGGAEQAVEEHHQPGRGHQRGRAEVTEKPLQRHSVVEPDALERRAGEHLRNRGNTDRDAADAQRRRLGVPDDYRQDEEDAASHRGIPTAPNGGPSVSDRDSLEYRLKFASPLEKQSIQRQLDDAHDAQQEEALSNAQQSNVRRGSIHRASDNEEPNEESDAEPGGSGGTVAVDDQPTPAAVPSRRRQHRAPTEAPSTADDDEAQAEDESDDGAEFEQALSTVPFAERMHLRKADTAPLEAEEADRILDELAAAVATAKFRPAAHRPAAESLCIFLPANAHNAAHAAELQAAIDAWGDTKTTVFTENRTLFHDDTLLGDKVNRAFMSMKQWKVGHHRRILHRWLLRARGSTKASLRGRGELSLPLLYWLWQERDNTFSRCGWFMKADTDSFINKRQLLHQLRELNPRSAYYVGTQLPFDSHPYNYSQPSRRIRFNIGGPGYLISRGALENTEIDKCFQSMAMDPIWLIHDDVGVGYCVTQFSKLRRVNLVEHNVAVSATKAATLEALLEFNPASNECYPCASAFHPVSADRMLWLARHFSTAADSSGEEGADDTGGRSTSSRCNARQCGATLVEGFRPSVGKLWDVPRSIRTQMATWPRSHLAEDLV